MQSIVMIEGNVDYRITLDPGVWIFDDRKVDLATFFTEPRAETNETDEYAKAIARQWDDQTRSNPISPPIERSTKKFEKEKVLTGSYGIPMKPFLNNASPRDGANEVILVTGDNEISLSLVEAYEMIAGFSKDGKPLREDGPIHIYYGDGSNRSEPIREVSKIIVK